MRYLVLLFVITAAMACQKEVTGDPPDPTTPAGPRLLTKYIYNQEKKYWIDTFSFDQQNRVTRIDQVYIDSANSVVNPYLWYMTYHYNGNDQLPFKITDTSDGRDMNWYLLYDGQKRRTLDSVVYLDSGEKWIVIYTYSGNRVVMNSTYSGPSGTSTDTDTLESDGANWIRYAYKNPANPQQYYQLKISYDNRPNPFTTLNISPLVARFGITSVGDFTQSSKNNALKLDFLDATSATPLATVTYQYVYDADGFPVSTMQTYSTTPGEIYREKFFYNK